MLRRLSISEQWLRGGATVISFRFVKRKLSPDRTRDEEIQDRQNAFVWADRHTFRPHQHFTYDPCSWSRPLVEKTKSMRKLALVERLRALEEREATAHAETSTLTETDYFYDAALTESEAESPLQSLLDELLSLQCRLAAPRHVKGTALGVWQRWQRAHDTVLQRVFERVRGAVVGETITLNALLYAWFLLLQSAPALLDGRSAAPDQCAVASAVADVRRALDILLRAAQRNASGLAALTPAARVEWLDVLTHPLVVRTDAICAMQRAARQSALTAAQDALQALHNCPYWSNPNEERVRGDGAEAETEWVMDALHLFALLRGLSRRVGSDAPSLPFYVMRLTAAVTDRVAMGLRECLGTSRAESLRSALVGQRDALLGASGPPKGVLPAPDAPCDPLHCTHAVALLLQRTDAAAPAVSSLLSLLAFTPNYDLDTCATVRVLCEARRAGLLADVRDRLRALLILSRLPLSLCTEQTVLGPLLRQLCEATDPIESDDSTRREWRRLRGNVMHSLLQSVRAAALCQDDGHWEERLAFGSYMGSVPLTLWRDTCAIRLSVSKEAAMASSTAAAAEKEEEGGEQSIVCARALLALRARCATPLDLAGARVVVLLLARQMEFKKCAVSDLEAGEANAWEVAQRVAGEDPKLGSLLRDAQQRLREEHETQEKVSTFA